MMTALAVIVVVGILAWAFINQKKEETPTSASSSIPARASRDNGEVETDRKTAPSWVAPADIKTPNRLQKVDPEGKDELSLFIQEITYRRKDYYYRATLASGQDFAVGVSPPYPWLDVIARTRRKGEKGGLYTGPYDICGFHAVESRWAHSDGPPGALEIRKILADHFGTPEKIGRFR